MPFETDDHSDAVVRVNTAVAWNLLLRFPTRLLRMPARSRGRTSVSSASRVKEQVRLEDGSLLRNQGRETEKHPHRRVDPLRGLACQVTRKIEACDFKGAVQLASSEGTLADFDDVTYSALLSKHPALHPHTCIPSLPPTPVPMLVSPGVALAGI